MKEKIFRLPRDLAGEFEKLCTILGISEREAGEQAIRSWMKASRDEAQKKLDLYAEKGITIIQPATVNIAVFQKADVMLAKEEVVRLLSVLAGAPAESRREFQLQLAQALKRVQPVYVRTRDPGLQQLMEDAERSLGS